MLAVSDTIKLVLERKGITQAELCNRLGTKPNNLSNKLSRGSFSALDLVEIAEVLGMELAFVESEEKYIIEYPEEEKFKAKRKETEEQKKKLIEKAKATKAEKMMHSM